MGILMEALAYQKYNGRAYIIGDEIAVATEAEACDMEALRLARRKPKVPALLITPTVATRAMEAEQAETQAETQASEADETRSRKRKGKYNHRELSAQR